MSYPYSLTRSSAGKPGRIKSKWDATAAPTTGDDANDGYSVGSRWGDVTNDKEYVCLDATVGAAVWLETTGSGDLGYEEGSWTPTLTFATPGDLAVTYGVRTGRYIRVGRLVTLTCEITTTAFTHTTATGELRVTGIPYDADPSASRNIGAVDASGWTSAAIAWIEARINENGNYVRFRGNQSGGAVISTGVTEWPTAATISLGFTISYFTDADLPGAGLWIASGTAFPASPSTGDLFHRTDLSPAIWRYDGTRWLCTCLHMWALTGGGTNIDNISTSATVGARSFPTEATGPDLWLEDIIVGYRVRTTNNATNFWTIEVRKAPPTGASTLMANPTSAAEAVDTFHTEVTVVDAVVDVSVTPLWFFQVNKTLSPGNIDANVTLRFRFIAT